MVPISPDYDDAIWTVLTLGEGAKAPATQSDHPFKTSANFHDFLPLVGSFLVLSVDKFGKFLALPTLKHANV